jgi:hypothetical protein
MPNLFIYEESLPAVVRSATIRNKKQKTKNQVAEGHVAK